MSSSRYSVFVPKKQKKTTNSSIESSYSDKSDYTNSSQTKQNNVPDSYKKSYTKHKKTNIYDDDVTESISSSAYSDDIDNLQQKYDKVSESHKNFENQIEKKYYPPHPPIHYPIHPQINKNIKNHVIMSDISNQTEYEPEYELKLEPEPIPLCKNIEKSQNISMRTSKISQCMIDNNHVILLDIIIINNSNKNLTNISLIDSNSYPNMLICPISYTSTIKINTSTHYENGELLNVHKSHIPAYSIGKLVIKILIKPNVELQIFDKLISSVVDICIPNYSLILNGILTTEFNCGCCSNNIPITPIYNNIITNIFIINNNKIKKVKFQEPDENIVKKKNIFTSENSESYSDLIDFAISS